MATGIPVAFFRGEFPTAGELPLLMEFTMLTFTEAQNQFISLFGQTARYHHRYKVFSDFV